MTAEQELSEKQKAAILKRAREIFEEQKNPSEEWGAQAGNMHFTLSIAEPGKPAVAPIGVERRQSFVDAAIREMKASGEL